MLKCESIKRFLIAKTVKDLADLYSPNMECQVNVAQDNGTRIEDDYKGKKWHGWTDGVQTWKSFRIPYNASTNPEYTDSDLNYSLDDHAEGIGMTGWDWVSRKSIWVAYDFDAIINHSVGLTNEQLKEIVDITSNIEWITVRKSTSGKGIHLYVMLEPVPTENHTEHAALARSILGYLSSLTGFDFESKVDGCGGNMWVWHRKMTGTDGLQIIKQGTKLTNIPANWKDHLKVVTHKSKKIRPKFDEQTEDDLFSRLTSQRAYVEINDQHKKLINWLDQQSQFVWWWDSDNRMLVTHTGALQKAHEDLNLKGIFKTISQSSDPNTQNCFLYPMNNGGWIARRFTKGIQESETWTQDSSGWTMCYFNQDLNLETAATVAGGVENDKFGFTFSKANQIIDAAKALGVKVEIPESLINRKATMKKHKDGRLIIEIERNESDTADEMKGWLADKYKGLIWRKIYNYKFQDDKEPQAYNYDEIVRHLTNAGEDCGWVIKNTETWQAEPLTHVKMALMSSGDLKPEDVNNILGDSVLKCWTLANLPFQPEYPGNRVWNRDSAQMRFIPKADSSNLKYDTWSMILNHCGKHMDDIVKDNEWCKLNAITCGADYLKVWIASMFQEPLKPLPYLFFYGPQNSGKSIFHEAVELLMTKGYTRADLCLQEGTNFNGELENAVLCVVEETDLSRNKNAYNKIKDWVTARSIQIRHLYQSPYHVKNSTHWIQCSNDAKACPIFPGDTRITMIYVGPIETIIAKDTLIKKLEGEAVDFVTSIINLEIPKTDDRLNLPILESSEKHLLQTQNKGEVERFIDECCYKVDGASINYSEFYDRFIEWLGEDNRGEWSKIKMGRELPTHYPKGRGPNAQFIVGNLSFNKDEKPDGVLYLKGEFLYKKGNK